MAAKCLFVGGNKQRLYYFLYSSFNNVFYPKKCPKKSLPFAHRRFRRACAGEMCFLHCMQIAAKSLHYKVYSLLQMQQVGALFLPSTQSKHKTNSTVTSFARPKRRRHCWPSVPNVQQYIMISTTRSTAIIMPKTKNDRIPSRQRPSILRVFLNFLTQLSLVNKLPTFSLFLRQG